MASFAAVISYGDGMPESLAVGFTTTTFSNVNITDALASVKVWATSIVRNKGYSFEAETAAFDSSESVGKAVREGKIDLVICRAKEYLEIAHSTPLDPFFVSIKDGSAEEECLLLVHRQSRIEKWEDLSGKEILLSNSGVATLGRLWLEVTLMERGFASLESFFKKTSGAAKPSQAVLPVFFQKTDACIVARGSYDTVAELNPQLRNQLRLIAQSPAFAGNFVCIRRGYNPKIMPALIDSLTNLHRDPRGQQILILFKTDRLAQYEKSYSAKIEQLIRRHGQLQKSVKTQ